MLDCKRLSEYINRQWDEEILPSLCDYVTIPNKSPHFDSEWEANGFMEKAITHIAAWCQHHAPVGLILEIVRLPGRTPLLVLEVPGQLDETVLLYGHCDKQPEMTGWETDPWIPVIKDGRLYGRGAADDGYAAYAALTAIAALQDQGLAHARCILLIECSEESGSPDLPFYMATLQERLGSPSLVICLDSGAGNYDQLWMTTSLRGNVVGELSVALLREGVHSGFASGVVADGFRIAKQLISRLEDERTGQIIVEEFHCDIPQVRSEEALLCARILGDAWLESLPLCPGVKPVDGSLSELILNRTWRSALTVTGADGLPAIADAGNVMRPKTTLKLSMRLPPTLCSKYAGDVMRRILTEHPPYEAIVTFRSDEGSNGWDAPLLSDWLAEAVNEASLSFFNKPAAYMGEGGTIPFMSMLGLHYPEAQFVITGVLGPHSNAHGPNEFLHLDMAKKLTACVAFILHQHAI